ncbi:hypothetical protein GR212_19960 [Rhizobium lusitanum]|uniref:Uncharacterized protein n=1 Tax=Rhizobium lusitanum TaxID=293958 RepID=A0A6L9U8R5_9HYPH|nr:hypothetical protein [Rhizobium lusitanum]NEI71864.1 hypothetical protein [Rhizobium lusitanum]
MQDYIVEGFVHVDNSLLSLKHICNRISQLCQSISRDDVDWLINFGEGNAILRPGDNKLLFRISTQDILIFYGIQTIIEGSLSDLPKILTDGIEWIPGTEIPFATTGV